MFADLEFIMLLRECRRALAEARPSEKTTCVLCSIGIETLNNAKAESTTRAPLEKGTKWTKMDRDPVPQAIVSKDMALEVDLRTHFAQLSLGHSHLVLVNVISKGEATEPSKNTELIRNAIRLQAWC
jgi:hypothetical protein